jgi:hypothetical protein
MQMQETLVTMHLDDCGAKQLREGLIERFAIVTDEIVGFMAYWISGGG